MLATSLAPKMWFATRDYGTWIDTPLSGADVSPEGWSAGGALLNGGGWQKKSAASHKTFQFSWRNSSAQVAAQKLHSFRDGAWGDGPFYFVDPLTYKTNILPKGWAQPSLGAKGFPSLIPGVKPVLGRLTWGDKPQNFRLNDYPLMWATYGIPGGAPVVGRKLFIPIPEGMSLHFGAVWQGTPSVSLKMRRVKWDGTYGTSFTVESVPAYDDRVTISEIVGNGDAGVELWVEKIGVNSATFAVKAMTARLQPEFKAPGLIQLGPWIGGQGNSGVEFDGEPTYVNNTGVNGGQVGYTASFREVGDWL